MTLGASGQGDVKRRPRTEGSGSHMATEISRRMGRTGATEDDQEPGAEIVNA